MIAVIIAGVLLVLIAILGVVAAIAIPTFNRVQEKAKVLAAQREAAKPAPPLTTEQKAQARQFGILLVNALNSKSASSVKDMTDLDTAADRVLTGFTVSAKSRQEFVKDLKENQAGIMSRFLGSHSRVLRLTERAGQPALTLRLSPGRGSVSYADVLLRPAGGTFKVVDIFDYHIGSLTSAEVRQAMLLMQSKDKGALGRLLGLDKVAERDIEMLESIVDKLHKHDFKGVLATYDAMPQELRKTRTAFVPYLTALENLQLEGGRAETYASALESAGEILGKDSTTDLMLFELHTLHQEYSAAQQCMDRVRLVIGEDAKLYQLQGMAAIRAGDLAAAEHCLAAAEKLEPELADLVDLRLQVRAMKRDFAGVVAELRRYASAARVVIPPAALKEAVYDEFKKSPEFAAWAKQAK